MKRKTALVFSSGVFLLLLAGGVPAAETVQGAGSGTISEGMDLLAKFFMLSVVVEVAFSTLFNWKFYLIHFHDKGYKTPILVLSLFALCKSIELDIVSDLIGILFAKPPIDSWIGTFLTALLLAGGSGAMNTVFDKLRIRNSRAVDERARELQAALARQDNDSGK